MIRVTLYALALAACILFGSCTQEEEELGDAVAVVDKHIDVKEVVHFKRRTRIEQTEGQKRDENLYSHENDESKFLQSVSSGVHIVTDSGNVEVCGPPNAKIDITWTPKILKKDGDINVYIDMVAPIEINKATIKIDVHVQGVPVISWNKSKKCADAKRYIPALDCPIQKGFPLKFHTEDLNISTLPTGNYSVEVHVTNEEQKLFACLKLKLIIVDGI